MIITNGKATKFCARKWKNKSEKRKNNEKQLKEKERKSLILKFPPPGAAIFTNLQIRRNV